MKQDFVSGIVKYKGVIGVCVLGLTAFCVLQAISGPLADGIRLKESQEIKISNVLNEAKVRTQVYSTLGQRKLVVKEEEISQVVDEITKKGEKIGINFAAMTQGALAPSQTDRYLSLPLSIKLSSTYEAFGNFMGSLDELGKGLAIADSFHITGDTADPDKIQVQLTIHIYVIRREAAYAR